MSLKEQILEDIKKFMKEKNTVSLNTVRMLKSDVKNAEIDVMRELNDAEILKVIQSSIKKRKDSADIYIKANRQELADKELLEVKTLELYLPAQMSENEVIAVIKTSIAEMPDADSKNFGLIMKSVMAKVSGKAEGRVVSGLIKDVVDGKY